MSNAENPNEAVFVRIFDAPRQVVWDAWTKEEHLKQWFGPTGSQITYAKMELRSGGSFHYCMKHGEHGEMWGIWKFREVDPPKKIQLVQSFSDRDGGISTHPMAPTWPKKTLSTTTFEETNGKTTMTLRWEPFDATQEEIDTFNAGRAGMDEGWGGTFARLDEYLARAGK